MPAIIPSTAPFTVSTERSALLADALLCARSLRLRVHGESMLPSLWPGDVVEIESCTLAEVLPGAIVLAQREDRLFLHRLVSSTPAGFRLRGDSMPGPDPHFPAQALLGRLVTTSAQARRISAPALSRAVGLLLCHCTLARRLALQLHRRRPSARDFRLGAL